ncbi:MAG: hypothetical protein ACD_57C00391G0010 [uncultured bacterium]|uniref:SpoVT-AbrB domain-containing protein n=1 Tax=Candidatus Woesebacteria bacterium RIFCSPHIGHO2_12_FULL_41_24 TaxID=1802510 RepID=A0A1F8ATP8_9BACT|nr:MAG: hypothetical protein ACD_57C00391G0010 [uncultured bacterium]OGM12937.1 MAG: hypothetical protein A2W15_01065 [Candidatus Woesebacteria bacterium RBG_16_41_13]OGM28777.1 MAG: hypothetical protein A2873_01770 [Candidatus Woesebacteria bacterium RIFCSPHIGHO2_01_FULL_42_80]OGM34977.1 MAG: hypothetical protein A3D84_06115 [Candidatus Woesebacteria bacterium RIFCSPHIGHO2_02_FULL_42_20]OGM54668.1 MAG: hypothetical protein A3E44_02475 [Candidatus Woesebacteria bacterium RIFCSPHIGHO2_12_FULL_41
MQYTATITSKRQLTIPSQLFKNTRLTKGDKVLMEEKQGSIVLKPATALIEELAGSVKVPKNLRGVDIDEAIMIAKKNYFGRGAK